MSDDASKIDPRFDPAFQRGFDGPVDAVPPARRESLLPSPARPVTTAPTAAARGAVAASAVSSAAPDAPRELVEPTTELDPAPRRPNPFLVALLVIAAALIVGGFYLVARLNELFTRSQNTGNWGDYIAVQVLTIAAPVLGILGVATAIGVVFIYAVRWGRT